LTDTKGTGVSVETSKVQGDRRGVDGEIVVVPDDIILRGSIDTTILQTLQENNVAIASSCGGLGSCGECKIRFVEEAPDPTACDLERLDAEQISRGWRLACQHMVGDRMAIEIRPESGELNHKEQDDECVEEGVPNPAIRLCTVVLDSTSRGDRQPRAVQVRDALGCDLRIPVSVLQQLSDMAIARHRTLSVITNGDAILEVLKEVKGTIHGLAIDVGTTTLAVYLFDLQTGRRLGVAAGRNPQRRFGADVISRIAHVRREKGKGLSELHGAVVEGLNELIGRLTVQSSVLPDSIYDATVVGNPTMLHLLLSVNPVGIDVSPYVTTFEHAVRTRADVIGLAINPHAVIRTLPAISAYVGADIIAGIIATGLHKSEDRTLFLDVGTNGEIVLAIDGRLIACSAAAGPAFEGASLVQGMPALQGAIESVHIHDGVIQCTVIGGGVPVGICGTGLLSAVAECCRIGAIDASGRICSDGPCLSNRIDGDGKNRRIRLTDVEKPVHLHQSDVREFQLAKAAIRAGIELLLQHVDLRSLDLDRVLIGGAFSTRMSSEHLIETGFLPNVDPRKIQVAGNVAGRGAKHVLLNRDLMEEAKRLARRVEYLELSGDSRFSELYVKYIPLSAAPRS